MAPEWDDLNWEELEKFFPPPCGKNTLYQFDADETQIPPTKRDIPPQTSQGRWQPYLFVAAMVTAVCLSFADGFFTHKYYCVEPVVSQDKKDEIIDKLAEIQKQLDQMINHEYVE